jgi:hypothetical protein
MRHPNDVLRQRHPPTNGHAQTCASESNDARFANSTEYTGSTDSDELPLPCTTPTSGSPRRRSCRRGGLEWGGTPGVVAIILLAHFVAYYLLLCVAKKKGGLYPLPLDLDSLDDFVEDLVELAQPTAVTWGVYLAFLLSQIVLALVCPGPTVYGYPVAVETGERVDKVGAGLGKNNAQNNNNNNNNNNNRLPYKCNALSSWWVTLTSLVVTVVVHGDDPLIWIADNRGGLMTCAVCVADVGALFLYLRGLEIFSKTKTKAPRASPVYDFFTGTDLNPRSIYGKIDLKMVSVTRVAWVSFFLLVVSAAAKQARNRDLFDDDYTEDYDGEPKTPVSPKSVRLVWANSVGIFLLKSAPWIRGMNSISAASFLTLGHGFLYANAPQKGETFIPFTFLVCREKFGWLLVWWSLVAVPFLYTAVAFVLAELDPKLSVEYVSGTAMWGFPKSDTHCFTSNAPVTVQTDYPSLLTRPSSNTRPTRD